jgi:signal transduction histidine kinase
MNDAKGEEKKMRKVLRTNARQKAEKVMLASRHQVEVIEVTRVNEQKLNTAEGVQLRALMGNVAHDLKTPLHSLEADIEALKLVYAKIPKRILDLILREGSVTINPESIFDSAFAACKFMLMAINRSQDYMKGTSNIALQPAMETFDIREVINMTVRCIGQLTTEHTLVVHPFAVEMCPFLISDRHWLGENLL